MRKYLIRSMLVRITFITVLSGLIPCTAVYFGMTISYEKRAVSVRMAEVQNQCTILSDQITSYDYMSHPEQSVIRENLAMLTNIYNGRAMIIDSDLIVREDSFRLFEGRTFLSERVISCLKGEKGVGVYDAKNKYIEVVSPIYDTKKKYIEGALLVGVATDTITGNLSMLRTNGRVIIIVAMLAVSMLGMLWGFLLLSPVRKLRRAFANVSDEHSDTVDGVCVYNEISGLYDEFQKTLSRLKLLDDSRSEFVSNVSHELKTPLASMKVLAESILISENVPPQMYREFLEDIAQEIDRENAIISDLLTLIRLDKTEVEPSVHPVDVNALLEEILKRLQPIADRDQIEIVLVSMRQVTAELDAVKISLAVTNLVENAIKYNQPGGTVHVHLDADFRFMYIRVRDNGIGIEQADLDRIFERFYRADKSHSHEIGGTGLGLSIAKNIILLHHGTVTAESVLEEGTVFTVKIPLLYQKINLEKG